MVTVVSVRFESGLYIGVLVGIVCALHGAALLCMMLLVVNSSVHLFVCLFDTRFM